mgnify:CR=1 FL=1
MSRASTRLQMAKPLNYRAKQEILNDVRRAYDTQESKQITSCLPKVVKDSGLSGIKR